jgi:hypothetical protein
VFGVFRGKQSAIRAHLSHPWSICGWFEFQEIADPEIGAH